MALTKGEAAELPIETVLVLDRLDRSHSREYLDLCRDTEAMYGWVRSLKGETNSGKIHLVLRYAPKDAAVAAKKIQTIFKLQEFLSGDVVKGPAPADRKTRPLEQG